MAENHRNRPGGQGIPPNGAVFTNARSDTWAVTPGGNSLATMRNTAWCIPHSPSRLHPIMVRTVQYIAPLHKSSQWMTINLDNKILPPPINNGT